MVATVNTAKTMKPMIVIYDDEVPKEEAMLVDLEHEEGVNIFQKPSARHNCPVKSTIILARASRLVTILMRAS